MGENIKIVQKTGAKEEILDLESTHVRVLVQFSNMILRHRDLSDPYWQNMLRQFNDALKGKLDKMTDGGHFFDHLYLKEGVEEVDKILNTLAAMQVFTPKLNAKSRRSYPLTNSRALMPIII